MSRPLAAVRCALALIARAGFVDFLRRLAVIVVEDAILHPLLPFVVWLTAVSAKRRESVAQPQPPRDASTRPLGKDGAHENLAMARPPTTLQVEAALRVVFDVAAVALKDAVGRRRSSQAPPSLSADDERWTAAQRACVKALLLRAHAGGMEGDVELLRSAALLWTRRFAAESRQIPPTDPSSARPSSRAWLPFLSSLFDASRARQSAQFASVSLPQLTGVQDDDVLLSAIDQHCSPLIDLLRAPHSPVRDAIMERVLEQESARQQRVDVVRLLAAVIWRYRSRTTNKRPLLPGAAHRGSDGDDRDGGEDDDGEAARDRRLYDRIKVEADAISRRIVAKRLVQQQQHTR